MTKAALGAPISILPNAPISIVPHLEPRPSLNHKETEVASLVSRVPQPGPICRKDCL